jgi:MYXO-CTERM domain-containing protein
MPDTIDLGSALVGTVTATKPLTIVNAGDIALMIATVALTGGGAPDFRVDKDGNFMLMPGDSTTVNVSFAPADAGPASAHIEVTATGLPPQSITVTGTGFTDKVALTGPGGSAVLDFGTLAVGTASSPLAVTVHNASPMAITLGAIVSSDPAFTVDTSMTKNDLEMGADTTFNVTYTAPAAGPSHATISVGLKGASAPLAQIGAVGSGASTSGCAVARGGPDTRPTPLGALGALGLLALALRRRGRR